MLSIIFGLTSALAWGGCDFVGGLSSRRVGAYRAVMYVDLLGIFILLGMALASGEAIPPLDNWLYSAAAGLIGSLGLAALYHAMAIGQMSVAAPVSALLAAALPVVVSAVTEGLPGVAQMTGLAFALAAVWLISQSGEGAKFERLADLRLPFLAGLGFGTYFVVTHFVTQSATLWPMIASRIAGASWPAIYLLSRRQALTVPRSAWGFVGLNALLDVGGNLFYVLAGQVGRLDVAAVLSSLYPGGTVALAWLLLKERLTRVQMIGIGAALAAIVLMML